MKRGAYPGLSVRTGLDRNAKLDQFPNSSLALRCGDVYDLQRPRRCLLECPFPAHSTCQPLKLSFLMSRGPRASCWRASLQGPRDVGSIQSSSVAVHGTATHILMVAASAKSGEVPRPPLETAPPGSERVFEQGSSPLSIGSKPTWTLPLAIS
jgi:hypothetical protein